MTMMNAFAADDASVRLRAALAAGTHPDPTLLETLVQRCAVEPDFFVRDMLTWALTRLPADRTVPRLLDELRRDNAQARAQALHTLSKIGDPAAWPAITPALLHDADDEVARTAWRTATVLVPDDRQTWLAGELGRELGRGDRDTRLALSRALLMVRDGALDDLLAAAGTHPDETVRAHAAATARLRDDPDSGFADARTEATRVAIVGPA